MTATKKVAVATIAKEPWEDSLRTTLASRGYRVVDFDRAADAPLDGLIVSVESLADRFMADFDPRTWAVNLRASLDPLLNSLDAARPNLRRGSSVAVVMPAAAFDGGAGQAEAAAAAGAVVGLLRSLAAEWGEESVRINGVAATTEVDPATLAGAIVALVDGAGYVTGEVLRLGIGG